MVLRVIVVLVGIILIVSSHRLHTKAFCAYIGWKIERCRHLGIKLGDEEKYQDLIFNSHSLLTDRKYDFIISVFNQCNALLFIGFSIIILCIVL